MSFLVIGACTHKDPFLQRTPAEETNCQKINPTQLSFDSLVEKVQNPSCKIKTIDDAIKILPDEIFKNGTLIYKSRSLQGPHKTDYFNPRALLHLQDRFFLTFNNNPSDPGYNSFEIAEANLESKNINNLMVFREITFPEDAKQMNWNESQKHIKISSPNPAKCTQCHGIPARPVFPSYPLWVGFYGFANGKVDPLEEVKYKELEVVSKKNKNSRYHRYDFSNPSPQLFMRNEGLNDILGNINSAIIARKIKATKNFQSYKYAIYASLINCKDSPSFLGSNLNDHIQSIDENFKISKKWSSVEIQNRLKQIVSSQRLFKLDHWLYPTDSSGYDNFFSKYGDYVYSRPKRLSEDFVQEIQKNFIDHMKLVGGPHPFLTTLATDTFDMQSDYERMYYTPTLLRLIFEARGIPLNTWALDLTQPTYRFHMTLQNIIHHLGSTDPEPLIKELLSISIKGNEGISSGLTPELNENKSICDKLKIVSTKKMAALPFKGNPIRYSSENRNNKYPTVFSNTCTKCHGQYDFMAPYIPFENQKTMEDWLSDPKNLKLLNHRVFNAKEDALMPPTRYLSDEEKDSIRQFIKK